MPTNKRVRGRKHHSRIAAHGSMTLSVYRPDESGIYQLDKTIKVDNMIVNTGLDWLADQFHQILNPSEVPAFLADIAVGSNGTEEAATDIALGTEIDRIPIDTVERGDGVGVVARVSATFDAGVGTGTWAEAGIFTSEGVMFDRVTFAATPKEADTVIQAVFSFTFSSV